MVCSQEAASALFRQDGGVSGHRCVCVLPVLLLKAPLGVGILLPTFAPEVPDLAMAGPFPAVDTQKQSRGESEGKTGEQHEQPMPWMLGESVSGCPAGGTAGRPQGPGLCPKNMQWV